MLLAKGDKKIYIGEDLRELVSEAQGLEKRDCYAELQKYLNHPKTSKVLSLCGLRRTGKTTMAAQAILDMDPEHFAKACFIAGDKYRSMDELETDMTILRKYEGYQYFFIDEITAIPDFIRNSAWLSDMFCKMGKRVVLTGTDSLSLIMAGWDHLYARQNLVRTSYIPYHEFYRLLKAKNVEGINDIDTCIKFGGTLVQETDDGNPDFSESPFATLQALGKYINTAISGNILHSLQYDDSIQNEYSSLKELAKEGRLQNIINRIVAFFNTRLTLEHLADAISLPLPNIMHLAYQHVNITQPVDKVGDNRFDSIDRLPEPIRIITKDYLNSLNIKESIGEGITNAQMQEIEDYLESIGLLRKVRTEILSIKSDQMGERKLGDVINVKDNFVIVQPGMQYCIASALVDTITKYELAFIKAVNDTREAQARASRNTSYNVFDDTKMGKIKQNILDITKGNILENVVLVEATEAAEDINKLNNELHSSGSVIKVYKLQFHDFKTINQHTKCSNKEIDMVVKDSRSNYEYRLFEIKHSDKIDSDHYKHLVSPDIQWAIETYSGPVVQRTVLYRGPSKVLDNGIIYYNVEDFLCKLGEDPNFLLCDLKAEIMKEEQSKAQVQALTQTLEMNDQTQELEQEPKEDINNDDIDQCQYDATDWCER